MTEYNGVMMQYFHWYNQPDGNLWCEVEQSAEELAKLGVTSLWLPPACKGTGGGYDVGYGLYDLFDLGEFDQKDSVRTKYGTKDEYVAAIKAAQKAGIRIYADAVFNHKMGADLEEEAQATPFPGRRGKYSSMEWHWWHFDAIDYNAYNEGENAIYLLQDKEFDNHVDLENGNFDYLMGCDLDMDHPEVVGELQYWGKWYVETTGVDGFRFDAVKHVKAEFFRDWLNNVSEQTGKDLFAVGEYWSYDVEALHAFLETTNGRVMLFDAPLHYNFHVASKSGSDYNFSEIFDNTLVQQQPTLAVTLVDNHDSQPLQSLESVVEAWFKPLAYALILLRREGYPCIFYADYYGAHYKDKANDGNEYEIWIDSHKGLIDKFLEARQSYAFGDQFDYFDHPNTIGWTRLGTAECPGAMAVVMSNGSEGSKWMEVGQPNHVYVDLTEHISDEITTNDDGWAEFRCSGGSVSVWVPKPQGNH
jgi:alpha-amylase